MTSAMASAGASELLTLLREVELRRVDARGHVYLDYTGAVLYPESLLRSHFALLRQRTLGNPHSENPASISATDDIAAAKAQVLSFFEADPSEYDVCFTSNASAAFRLVGESFPFDATSTLLLTTDNHNSINGIREFARRAGARVKYVVSDGDGDGDSDRVGRGLFAFPAQSNFSGVRYPLSWVRNSQQRGFHVLLDAASYVGTARLSLREVPADFVGVSFYKMFGYPSGIGALIARRDAVSILKRPWFAGGTVEFASVGADRHQLKNNLEAFEDGTVNFLAATGVSLGLSFLQRVGMQRIGEHVRALTELLLLRLTSLRHSNGLPLVRLYGPLDTIHRGGTVAFNLLDRTGALLNCDAVVAAAARASISLRSGCFCNPGAAEQALGLTGFETERPAGAVRASLGYGSNEDDIHTLADFLQDFATSRTGQ